MKLKNLMWGSAVLAAIVMVGCDGGSSSGSTAGTTTTASGTAGGGTTGDAKGGTTAAKKNKLKIVMIAKSSNNPVFLSAKTGAEAAAQDAKKQGVDVTVDWRTPNEEDGQVQAQRVAQAVNDGADAILISCSDAAKVTSAINDAVDKGVPVMTFDSDAPQSKRFAFYGADDEAVGKQVMDELGAATGGKGSFAILAGNQNAPNLQRRAKAVMDEAKAKFPDMVYVSTVNHVESPQDASAAVTREMNAKPQITAWAMVGGWPLFNTSLLTSLDPNKVKIVSVDALPAELAYVDKGLAPTLLAQPTYDWGYKSVGIIVDKVALGKDVPTINKMELVKVTKENLNQWAQQLQKWGFPGIDAKYLK